MSDLKTTNEVALRMRKIYCLSGSSFAAPELQAGWEEIERLEARVKDLENAILNIPDWMSEATNREMIDAIAAAKGIVKLEDKND